MTLKSLGQQNAVGRRFWMKLIADPGILNVVRLLELVDNALADIAEGSDVIGKDSDVDAHLMLQTDLRVA